VLISSKAVVHLLLAHFCGQFIEKLHDFLILTDQQFDVLYFHLGHRQSLVSPDDTNVRLFKGDTHGGQLSRGEDEIFLVENGL